MAKDEKEMNPEVFFNAIFERAASEGASDIHIEPLSNHLRIRFRIDGKLQEKWERPIEEHERIINKIKVLSNLEIAGKPLPQDGHFELIEAKTQITEAVEEKKSALSLLFSKKEFTPTAKKSVSEPSPFNPQNQTHIINVRASIFPTIYGEAAVLRLLNRSEMFISLKNFEMDDQTRSLVKKLISKNYGILLVTGPSGSGKTSMLYSIIEELKTKEKNIITLEDPVEYELNEIRQCQIKPDQGLTFAMGMKSILRQDPDIIMIGEIRDPETAEYAMRASLMGRSVFSTLHSNSSVGIIARLIDMNIERGLIAYALNGSISKRLVRKLCPYCKTAYTPAPQYLEYFKLAKNDHQFFKGTGCKKCNNTGYKGRIGLFEVMEIDDNMRSMIVEKSPMAALQEYTEKNMKTLKQDSFEKIMAGETTFEEVMGAV